MVFRASSRRPAPVSAWRCLIFVLLSSVLPVLARAQPEELPISLPEELLPELNQIIQHALAASPSIQLANLELARAEANYLVHRAAMLPTVSAQSSYNVSSQRRDDAGASSDDQGFFYQIGVTQPVFHWGARKAERDIGAIALLIQQKRLEDARAGLASALRTQYLDLIIRKLHLRNARLNEKLSEKALAAAEERFAAGNISESEITNQRLSTEEARLSRRRNEHDLETYVRIYAHLSGDPTFNADRIAESMPAPQVSPEMVEARFARVSPETIRDLPAAEVQELQLKQNEKRYEIERVRLRPRVSLIASHGLANLTTATSATIDQTAVVTTTAGVVVNWTIFDGLASRGARLAALAAKRVGERQYENFVTTTLNELRRIQREIELATDGLAIAERRASLVAEALERARADFAAGRIAQSTLDAHLSQSRATEVSIAGARSQLFARWIEYVGLAGLDPMRDAVAGDAQPLTDSHE